MTSVADTAPAMPTRRKPNAERRIRQLIRKHGEERQQLMGAIDDLTAQTATMQRIASQMMGLLPKQVVAHILSAAEGQNVGTR